MESTEPAPNTNPVTSDDSATYEAMAQAVLTTIDALLVPFHLSVTACSDGSVPPVVAPPVIAPRSVSTEVFFRQFIVYADNFTDRCCQEFSQILRHASVVPEVRGTPTLQLAREIRTTVFEAADQILVGYLGTLQQIDLDLGALANELARTSVLGEGLKGAAIGRVAGGFGRTGSILAGVGALAAAGQEAAKQAALVADQERLKAHARQMAFDKVVQYLKVAETLPEHLLDFACAKCFGGRVDFSRQGVIQAQLHQLIEARLSLCVGFTMRLRAAESDENKRLAVKAARSKTNGRLLVAGTVCFVIISFVVLVVLALMGAALDSSRPTNGDSRQAETSSLGHE